MEVHEAGVLCDKFITLLQDDNFEYQLATDPRSAKETGKYYVEGSQSRSPSASHDPSVRKGYGASWQSRQGHPIDWQRPLALPARDPRSPARAITPSL